MVAGQPSTAYVVRWSKGVTADRGVSAWWEDLGAALLGVTLVVALYLDGRAHLLDLPDSFFTPWHGLLYGSLVVLTGWLALAGWRRREPGSLGLAAVLRPPTGYGWALVGAGLFALGGVGDGVWHSVFGIEVGLDALLSPSHLWLFVSGALLLSGPLLAARVRTAGGDRPSTARLLPALLSVFAITGLVAFALSYVSAFVADAPTRAMPHYPEGTPEHAAVEIPAIAGFASYVVTSLVLVVPLVYLIRSWRLPFGVVTGLVAGVAGLAVVLMNFVGGWVVLAAAAAGLAADAILVGARRAGASPRTLSLVVALAVPGLLWTAQLAALHYTQGIRWPAALVGGAVAASALTSATVVLVLTQPVSTAGTQTEAGSTTYRPTVAPSSSNTPEES